MDRNVRPHSPPGLPFLALTLGSACLLSACSQGNVIASEREITIGGPRESVRARVSLTRIGIQTEDEVLEDEVVASMFGPSARIGMSYPESIAIVDLDKDAPLEDLVRLARAAEGSRWVKQAGLVVTIEDYELPFLATDRFVVQLQKSSDRRTLEAFNASQGVVIIHQNPFTEGQFLLAVTDASPGNVLDIVQRYRGEAIVRYAHPDWVLISIPQSAYADQYFGEQWTHENTGQGGGTVDADIDTPLAWDISPGSADTVIAIIDHGFESTHPDLLLWTNSKEQPPDGVDDDGDGLVDDLHGWNFADCVSPELSCGSSELALKIHGTAVAGVAGARGGNSIGVTGACPLCSLMLIQQGSTPYGIEICFDYARVHGADVICYTQSTTLPPDTMVEEAVQKAATEGRGMKGCVIACAMTFDKSTNDCASVPQLLGSMDSVIAVGASDYRDQRSSLVFGDCLDILAPTSTKSPINAPRVATTDLVGDTYGINNSSMMNDLTPPPPDARDYTRLFAGTSAAAPLVAGVAALVITADPTLDRTMVQRLLQDTADKIEDSLGQYDDGTGYSAPPGTDPTHGYGRLNAFEAVRIAAPMPMGRGGVDLFLRDNRLDWGNTEQPSNVLMEPVRDFLPHWESVDIKVDAPDATDLHQPTPQSSLEFDAFVDENPGSGKTSRVHVRVRNRGPHPANNVTVKLHWTFAGTGLPDLPADFWSSFPADASDTAIWHPLGVVTLPSVPYSGASVAATSFDEARIASFDFPAPVLDLTQPDPHHYCLLAVVSCADDPVSSTSLTQLVPDLVTPLDNNVTHRNVVLVGSALSSLGSFTDGLWLRNPFPFEITSRVVVSGPSEWTAVLMQRGADGDLEPLAPGTPLTLAARVRSLLRVSIEPTDSSSPPDSPLRIVQQRRIGRQWVPLGGMTYRDG